MAVATDRCLDRLGEQLASTLVAALAPLDRGRGPAMGPRAWLGPGRPGPNGDDDWLVVEEPSADERAPGREPGAWRTVHVVLTADHAENDPAARVQRWRRLYASVTVDGLIAVSFPVVSSKLDYGRFVAELLDGARGRVVLEELVVHPRQRDGERWSTTVVRTLGPKPDRG